VGQFESISRGNKEECALIAHELDAMAANCRIMNFTHAKHVYRYLTGLIHPSDMNRKSVSAVSEESTSPCNQSSLNRFLNDNRLLVTGINNSRIQCMAKPNNNRFLVIDDTILEHPYGENIEGVGRFWDSADKRWILGHNVVTSMAVNEDEVEPLDIGLYLKKEQAKKNGAVFRTKIEIAVEMIRARATALQVLGILFDNWYLCEKIMAICEKHGLYWYSDVRSNRIIYLPEADQKFNVLVLAKSLPDSVFKEVELPDSWKKYTRMAEKEVILKGNRTKARKIKLVILWDGRDDSDSFKFLATNDLSIDGVRLVQIRKLRWKIEEFHRDAKQNLGMADCMLRKYDGVVIHLLLVLLAYSVLKRLLASALKGVADTVGEACRYLKRQAMRTRYSVHTGS
jgi:SRSO17 transposase